jgi:hypothetical protein
MSDNQSKQPVIINVTHPRYQDHLDIISIKNNIDRKSLGPVFSPLDMMLWLGYKKDKYIPSWLNPNFDKTIRYEL